MRSKNEAPIILIRLVVGCVFVSEGIQKFLFSESVGGGRFAKIGIPNPEFAASFVGSVEILCGTLVLLGLLTRLAVIPLITIMFVAIATTKIPILQNDGFWKMAHDSRTDFSMILSSIFLMITGAGRRSVDAWLSRRSSK